MRNKILIIVSLMVSAFLMVLSAPGTSLAVNTPAGTTISNDVTVDYKVGGVDQTQIVMSAQSSAYTFVVDNKVDLTVTTTLNAIVIPGAADQAIGFTVTNTGNSTQRYALASELGAAVFPITNIPAPTIYIDLGVVGTFEAGTDVAYVDASTGGDVAVGGTLDVLIVGTIPLDAVNGNIESYDLLATAVDAGTTTVTLETVGDDADPMVVDVVFADEFAGAAGNHSLDTVEGGNASNTATYTVSSVTLTIAKSSTVISDPINGITDPIAIPGAVIQYSITITHSAGASDATDVSITDDLSTEIGNGTIVFNTQHSGGVCIAGEGMILDVTGGGGAACQTNASDSPADDSEFTGNTVSSSVITLTPGDTAVLTFEVTIQ